MARPPSPLKVAVLSARAEAAAEAMELKQTCSRLRASLRQAKEAAEGGAEAERVAGALQAEREAREGDAEGARRRIQQVDSRLLEANPKRP